MKVSENKGPVHANASSPRTPTTTLCGSDPKCMQDCLGSTILEGEDGEIATVARARFRMLSDSEEGPVAGQWTEHDVNQECAQ